MLAGAESGTPSIPVIVLGNLFVCGMEGLKRKLQIFNEKEEYLQYLIKTINDSLNVVNNDNSSIIFVTNNDKQKYEEVLNRYNIKIDVLDNDFIGGCKLKNDKLGVIIDNTLKTNLDEI